MKTLRKHLPVSGAAAALLFCAAPGAADVLIDLPPPAGNGSAVSLTQYNAVGFSLATGYIDVSIDASLTSTLAGQTGTAYLTTSIGAGTTVGDVIASTQFDFAQVGNVSFDVSFVNLFDGLSLGAGDYFLVVGAPLSGEGFISLSSTASYILDPNASINGMFFASSANIDPAFAPGSTFASSGLGNRFIRVSGVIPSPSTLGVVALGGLVAARRRRD